MAIRLDASGDSLSRATGLLAFGSLTTTWWFYRVAVIGSDDTMWYVSADSGVGSGYLGCYLNANRVWIDSDLGGGGIMGTNDLSLATWYRAAEVFDNTADTITFYVNGVQEAQSTGNTGTFTPGYETFGRPTSFNGRVAAIKTWTAALTLADINQEHTQYLPVRTTNLHRVTPCLKHTDLVDYSGVSGVAWTANGTLATEDGPPIPWVQGRRRVRVPVGVVTLPDLSLSLEEPAILISTF